MKNNKKVEWIESDVIVVGTGGAGSQAALAAAEEGLSVLVITKDPMSSSDTKICEGVMTVRESGDLKDTESVLSDNVKIAGADLPDENITKAFSKDSVSSYDRLRLSGLRPSINKETNKPKTLAIAMGGHNKSRSVGHKNGGLAFGHTNWDTLIKYKNIKYIEDCWFLEVIKYEDKKTGESHVTGGIAYDATNGKILALKSKTVIIASGGLSTLFFPKTDTMRGNTGDSYALGIRAGADLLDMEQIQFLPFCLASPPSYEGLLAGEPSTASFLGVLRDKNNKIILDSVYLRTRAECSEAIMRAVEDGRGSPNGGAYLDMTGNKNAPRSGEYFMQYLKSALPSAYNNARQALGKKAGNAEIPWEIRPSAHYSMGGIRVDEFSRVYKSMNKPDETTFIEGLYAAGQAMGGLFGANRLGSTSLTELAVFGYRAGKSAYKYIKNNQNKLSEASFEKSLKMYLSMFKNNGEEKAYKLKLEFQKECWDKIGPARTEAKLKKMLMYLDNLEKKLGKVKVSEEMVWNQQFIDLVEITNMLDTAKSITLASLERDKSLGGHVRLDKKTSGFFSKPYSTIVNLNKNKKFTSNRLSRKKTKLEKLLIFKLTERYRLFKARLIRLLPLSIRDLIIEQKYLKLLGQKGKPLELQPGSLRAAPADNKNNL